LKKQEPKRVLLIDGDTIAYSCSAAAEERSIQVEHLPTGIIKSFKTRTNFKELIQSKNKVITEDYFITDIQEAESPAFCFKVIKTKINNLKRDTQADIVEIYTEDTNNFRLDLKLPAKDKDFAAGRYKGNRSGGIRPILLLAAKNYLQTSHQAKAVDSMEVDDMLSIRAYEELAKGNIPIIAGIDKDTYQANGITLYNYNLDKPECYLVPEFGSLSYDNGKVKGDGYKFLCYQWLAGDNVDNYCAYDCTSIKTGPSKIVKLLNQANNVKELLEVVINTFKTWYPNEFEYLVWDGSTQKADYKYMMQMYFKCAWMKRSLDDKSDCYELFDKYGVDYD
jgi:hypothetical protein